MFLVTTVVIALWLVLLGISRIFEVGVLTSLLGPAWQLLLWVLPPLAVVAASVDMVANATSLGRMLLRGALVTTLVWATAYTFGVHMHWVLVLAAVAFVLSFFTRGVKYTPLNKEV